MSKSLFLIKVRKKVPEKKTIQQIASFTHKFLNKVKQFDKDENTFCFVDNRNKRNPLSISDSGNEVETDEIAKLILTFNKKDIVNNDGVKQPTTEYSRDGGFDFLITWHKSGKEILCLHFKMGGSSGSGYIGTMSFSMDYEKDFNWYYTTLQKLVNVTDAVTGCVYFKVNVFNNERPQVVIEPGWITYISDKAGLQLPATLGDVETERSADGVYIIATREDITQSKEYYEMIKKRVSDLHQKLIEKVPGYLIHEY